MASLTQQLAKSDSGPAAAYQFGDVASRMRVSSRTVRRLFKAGVVPGAFRVGRLVRFDAITIDSWIRAGCPTDPQAKS